MHNSTTSNPTLIYPETYSADEHSAEGPDQLSPFIQDTLESVEAYARKNPWPFGMWMLGIGFVLGWKLKIW